MSLDGNFNLNNYNVGYPSTRSIDMMIQNEAPILSIIEESNKLQVFRQNSMTNLHNWKNGNAPINSRILYVNGIAQINKINNHIQHDIISEVIEKKAGYMNGKPVAISLRKKAYPNDFIDGIKKEGVTRYDTHLEVIRDFELRNNMNDVRLQTTKYTALYGMVGRLLSGNSVSGVKADFISGECLAFYGPDLQKPDIAIYNVSNYEVRYYDNKQVSIYKRFTINDKWEFIDSLEHNFAGCPLIPFYNNEARRGDVLTSLSKINDVDERSSDLSSEMAQTRVQMLIAEDVEFSKEKFNNSEQLGVMDITTTAEGKGKMYYLNKNFNTSAHEILLERTRSEIYRDCKSADFSEIIKSGTSGETRKWSLLPLENNAAATELKLRAGEMRMWELVFNFYNAYHKGNKINYLDIQQQWSRDLPAELKTNMETLRLGFGYLPLEFLYSLFPDVDNPEELAREFRIENGIEIGIENIDVDTIEG